MIRNATKFVKLCTSFNLLQTTRVLGRHVSTHTKIVQKVRHFLTGEHLDLDQNSTTAHLFIGTGQYFQHKTHERVVVLSLAFSEDNSNSTSLSEVTDTSLNAANVGSLAQEISRLPGRPHVHSGEVDCVDKDPWNFGYVMYPTFSIFSRKGHGCTLYHSGGRPGFRIFSGAVYEDIPLSDITSVQLRLSGEPWIERYLELRMKSGEVCTVIADHRTEGSKDLGELMMSSEWMVKAAGHMCVVARQQPINCHLSLQLPKELRGEFNQWVALRNSMWVRESDT